MQRSTQTLVMLVLLLASVRAGQAQVLVSAAEPMGVNRGVDCAAVDWGDYDRDGDPDLVVSGLDDITPKPRLIVYRNDGATFTQVAEPMGANAGVRYAGVQWGDYDNDGDPDLAVIGHDGVNRAFKIFRNDGTFFTLTAQPMGASDGLIFASLDWGDYDRDGDLDLVVAGKYSGQTDFRLVIYRNDSGTFNAAIEPMGAGKGVGNGSVDWGDFDKDGDLDLVVSGVDRYPTNQDPSPTRARLMVFRNNGGSFALAAEPMGANAGLMNASVQWGDFDNDGDPDLAAAGYDTGDGRLIFFRNDNGVFVGAGEPMLGMGNLNFASLCWGDFDVDGDLDLIASGRGRGATEARLILFRNDNSGFTAVAEPMGRLLGVYNSSVRAADFDRDGDPDLVAAGKDNGNRHRLVVFRNDVTQALPLENFESYPGTPEMSAAWPTEGRNLISSRTLLTDHTKYMKVAANLAPAPYFDGVVKSLGGSRDWRIYKCLSLANRGFSGTSVENLQVVLTRADSPTTEWKSQPPIRYLNDDTWRTLFIDLTPCTFLDRVGGIKIRFVGGTYGQTQVAIDDLQLLLRTPLEEFESYAGDVDLQQAWLTDGGGLITGRALGTDNTKYMKISANLAPVPHVDAVVKSIQVQADPLYSAIQVRYRRAPGTSVEDMQIALTDAAFPAQEWRTGTWTCDSDTAWVQRTISIAACPFRQRIGKLKIRLIGRNNQSTQVWIDDLRLTR